MICVHAWQRNVPPRLEVFQTAGRGWGVRAAEALPQGTFVCCYLGEVTCDAIRPLRVGLWAALTAGRPHSAEQTSTLLLQVLSDEESERRRADGEQRADEYYTEIEVRRRLWQPIVRSIGRTGRAAQAAYGPLTQLVPDSRTHSLFSLPSAALGNSVRRSHCWAQGNQWDGSAGRVGEHLGQCRAQDGGGAQGHQVQCVRHGTD
jgi:hypothetical protein